MTSGIIMIGIFLQDIICSICTRILDRENIFKWENASSRFIGAEFAVNDYRNLT